MSIYFIGTTVATIREIDKLMKESKLQLLKIEDNLRHLIIVGNAGEVFGYLDSLVKHFNEEVLTRINELIAEPEILSMLIRRIIHDRNLLTRVLKESYYHENGFHKIVLAAGEHFKLRLHHFGSSTKMPMENIHDHRWPFASNILLGSLKMDIFQPHESEGEKLIHYRYNSQKSNGAYGIAPLGYKKLTLVRSVEYKAGEQYLMPTTHLHRIINKPGEESITLVLTGKPTSSVCNLYARRSITQVEQQPLKYEEKVLEKMLQSIVEKIYPTLN